MKDDEGRLYKSRLPDEAQLLVCPSASACVCSASAARTQVGSLLVAAAGGRGVPPRVSSEARQRTVLAAVSDSIGPGTRGRRLRSPGVADTMRLQRCPPAAEVAARLPGETLQENLPRRR